MGSKRNHDSVASPGMDEAFVQPSKRQRWQQANGATKQQREPQVDATYGQRWVFGALGNTTVPDDEELEFEDEHDALEYLRSVRYVLILR